MTTSNAGIGVLVFVFGMFLTSCFNGCDFDNRGIDTVTVGVTEHADTKQIRVDIHYTDKIASLDVDLNTKGEIKAYREQLEMAVLLLKEAEERSVEIPETTYLDGQVIDLTGMTDSDAQVAIAESSGVPYAIIGKDTYEYLSAEDKQLLSSYLIIEK